MRKSLVWLQILAFGMTAVHPAWADSRKPSRPSSSSSPAPVYQIEIRKDLCSSTLIPNRSTLQEAYCADMAASQSSSPVLIPYLSQQQLEKAGIPPEQIQKMLTMTKQTGYLVMLSGSVFALMTLLPESFTKWSSEDLKLSKMGEKWAYNVTRPPVIDDDDWYINYIGHPISGAFYYTLARTHGLSPTESFLYAVICSTFLWEYGVEAFAERPSVQDLIITPVVGSLIGEVGYQGIQAIDRNGGKVMGSTALGGFTKAALNPLGTTTSGVQWLLNPLIKDVDVRPEFITAVREDGTTLGLKLRVPFSNGLRPASTRDRPGLYQGCRSEQLDPSERSVEVISSQAAKAIDKKDFCKAAQRFWELDLQHPKEARAAQAQVRALEQLANGGYYLEMAEELARFKFLQPTYAKMDDLDFLQIKSYESAIPTTCLNPWGAYAAPNGNRLALGPELQWLIQHFQALYPKSSHRSEVDEIDAKLSRYLSKYKKCVEESPGRMKGRLDS